MSAPQAKTKDQSRTANKVGRPPFLTDVKRAEICAVIAVGCSYRTAAKYVGCTVQAISALAERDREFAAQLDRAVAKREIMPLSHIREASARSWRAAAWLLQYTVGGRYGGDVKTLEEELADEKSDEMRALIDGRQRPCQEDYEKPVEREVRVGEVEAPDARTAAADRPAAEQVAATPDTESPLPGDSLIDEFLRSDVAADEARYIADLLACLSAEAKAGPAAGVASPGVLTSGVVLSESISPQSILESMQALDASCKRRRMEA